MCKWARRVVSRSLLGASRPLPTCPGPIPPGPRSCRPGLPACRWLGPAHADARGDLSPQQGHSPHSASDNSRSKRSSACQPARQQVSRELPLTALGEKEGAQEGLAPGLDDTFQGHAGG